MDFLESIIQLVSGHRELAYAMVFLFAFLESLPLLGLFVPGSTLIVGASILVPSGALSLTPLLAVATLGSVAGDTVSFGLGRHYGRDLLSFGPLGRRPELVARAGRFFDRHGGKGVLFGRFTPPLRGIIPAFAGIARVGWGRFLAAATLAALAWAPAHVVPGALIGASLHLAGAVTARLAMFLLLLLLFGYLLVVIVRTVLFWGVPAGAAAMRRALLWARAHDNVVGREILALLDPGHREAKALAVLSVLLILGGWGFFAILEDVATGDPLVRADASIFHALQALRSPWGDMIMVAITELGDARVTIPVAAAAIGWLVWRRAWIDAAYMAAAIVFAQAFAAAIKIALHAPRPIPELYHGWSAFSFPSGHATVNAVMYGFLAVMTMRQAGPVLRPAIAGGLALLVGLIALSRIYLGAHWFSDVAAGLGFGAAWVGLLGIAYVRHRPAGHGTRGLLPVVAAVLAIAGAINIAGAHVRDLARYQPIPETPTMTAAEWITNGWESLPSHRIDLAGELEEPIVLQLAGTPEYLGDTLTASGWRQPAAWDAIGALAWLAAGGAASLPVLPKLHEGRPPVLMLELPEPDDRARIVLRLWDSRVRLQQGEISQTLWLATVTREDLRQPLGMLSVMVTERDANGPRDLLARTIPALRRHRADAPAGDAVWDGVLLLAAGGRSPEPDR
ncbi:MAG: VTT domain-containing protein [Alphaproteobacteria bacterium]|nr:VTT domain-containing protein [Alphaproteobacteria bacterium]